MNHIDISVFYLINGFARIYRGFDQLMVFLVGNNLLKGGILVMVLWWYWFRDRSQELYRRKAVLVTLISCLTSLAFIRILIMLLPFKSRPMHDPALAFIPPFGLDADSLENFSSFPSDHAGLFFALATGIYFISKKTGILAMLYVILVIVFPRLYLGYHYFSDLFVGSLIGASTTIILMKIPWNKPLLRIGINWSIRAPASFYTVFFLVTYQIAVLFDPLRQMGSFVYNSITALL